MIITKLYSQVNIEILMGICLLQIRAREWCVDQTRNACCSTTRQSVCAEQATRAHQAAAWT